MGALFARAALAACLLSSFGIACAETVDDDDVVPAQLTVLLCAQADGVNYTSDTNECELILSSGDNASVCEQAREALADAIAEPGHGKNRVTVIRKIIAKTCDSES